MYALINAKIYDYQNYFDEAYLIFDENIHSIGLMKDYRNQDYLEIDLKGKLIIPGFVSGHTHLYSTFARGMSNEFNPKNFLEILKQLWWKLDHFLDKEMIYYSAIMGGLTQLKMGTTTLIDHHASYLVEGSLEQIKKAITEKLGLRGIFAFETSDRFSIVESIKENINFSKNNKTKYSSGLFGMHASLSLSDESLILISENLGNEGIHIHVAESLMDEEECIKNYGIRVVERLEKYNLINEKSILVHCTHINETEMDIIKKHDATIAVNVTSNLNNAVGISKIKAFLDKGIRVISGNDGLIQSQPMEYLNIYYLSHLETKSPIGFSLDDLKRIILNTYEYTNMILKTKLGKFEKGAEADLLICDYKPFTPIDKNNIFGHLFFGVYPGFRPEKVFSRGKLVVDNFNFIESFEKEYLEANKQAIKLWGIIKKEGNNLEFDC